MSFNTFGKLFRFTTWGESHGPALGCVVDGCPPNIPLKEQDIQKELDRRKPGNLSLSRKEKKVIKFIFYLEFLKERQQELQSLWSFTMKTKSQKITEILKISSDP